jgi:hypothetical protein
VLPAADEGNYTLAIVEEKSIRSEAINEKCVASTENIKMSVIN